MKILMNLFILCFFVPTFCWAQFGQNDELVDKALTAMDAGEYEDAVLYFDQLTEKDPEDAINHFMKGKAHIALGQFLEARESFSTSIAFFPTHAEALYLRGFIHFTLNDFPNAIKDGEKLIELEPENPAYLFLYGSSIAITGAYKQGLPHLQKAVELDPDNPDYLFLFGYFQGIIGNENLAKGSFQRAIAAAEKSGVSLDINFIQGAVYQYSNAPKKAIKSFESVLQESPAYEPALFSLGQIYMHTNDFDKALPYFDKAISIDHFDLDAQTHKAYCLHQLGQSEKALTQLNKLLSTYSDYYNALVARGLVLVQTNQLNAALADIERALQLCPSHPGVYRVRAEYHFKSSNPEQGCKDLDFAEKQGYTFIYQNGDLKALGKANCE